MLEVERIRQQHKDIRAPPGQMLQKKDKKK
jgi:hypothetical protein